MLACLPRWLKCGAGLADDMILGIGTDTLDPNRIAAVYARKGEAFLRKVFTENEAAYALASPARTVHVLATRFAAKEACIKALGAKIGQDGGWTDIEVARLPSGQPILQLHHKAADRLAKLTPVGYTPKLHLSLSDADHHVLAFVVIEARPNKDT